MDLRLHPGNLLHFIVAFLVLILAGCAMVGPDYVPPQTRVSGTWHSSLRGGLTAENGEPAGMARWWTALNDPGLSGLVERAVAGNLDLKQARARIREARARQGVAVAGLFPTVDASASAAWSRNSKDTGYDQTSSLYRAGFDASWELDVFGGIRRSVQAAGADLQASEEDLRDTLVSLLAEVAVNYIELRTFQARLAVAESNLEAQSETHRLVTWRYEAGLSDALATQEARYNLENTRSQIPPLRTGQEEALNRIAVLLGEQPGNVHKELEKISPIPTTPLKVAIGIPAEALRRRPDVRKAERELAAQTARIGAAKADLYPRFTLSGSIGLEALSVNRLFSLSNRTRSGTPLVTWPVFDGGAIRQNIEIQTALQEQALIQYENKVLTALEEVENAVVAYAEEQQRSLALREASLAAEQAVELAGNKYQAGLANFISVLDAQRSLLSFQDQLAQSNGAITSNLVRLYKALGGGWESIAPEGKGRQVLSGEMAGEKEFLEIK